MEGKNVVVFLKTPLFRFKYLASGQEQQLLENAVRIEGKVTREKEMGLLMKVKELSNLREKQKPLPFETIFIPFDKVDYVILL